MRRLLVADDEAAIRLGIREYAEFEGYEVDEACDGSEAVQMCREKDYDLLILDIMMPKIDGFAACKKIRSMKDIPVIMLSAKGEEYDKLYGFELGVEDYVVKPFSLKELMARVEVVLRRYRKAAETEKNILSFEGLELNITGRSVTIDGTRVSMTPKEYDLLFFLAQHNDIVFSRDELLDRVWGYDYSGDGRTVDTHIKMLRQSLGNYRKFIVTHRGAGYKFES
jgi:two-component system response regulator ResD